MAFVDESTGKRFKAAEPIIDGLMQGKERILEQTNQITQEILDKLAHSQDKVNYEELEARKINPLLTIASPNKI